jgi:long-chain acyl-CoA synthetase
VDSPWDQRLGFWWIAQDQPDRPAVVDSPSGVTCTFGELAGRAHQIVHALRERDLGAGDIVAYALPNGIEILCWQYALQESGMHGIALNPALAPGEIRSILRHSGAAAVVLDHGYAQTAALAAEAPARLKIAVGGAIAGFESDDELVRDQPMTLPDDRTFGMPISYSSGTTGKPKAIARRAPQGDPAAIANEMKLFGQAFQFLPFDGVHLVAAGMHHGGCQSFYQGALTVGQALAVMGKFDAEQALRMIEEHQITTTYMVPTQFVRLLRLPDDVKARYDVSSLKVVVHSAAPCPLEVKRQMMDWWGPVIWETYGGMEGAAAIAKPDRWLERPGTVGRAVRGMKITILDEDGKELPPGETGHVYLESSASTFEYKGDPELTESVHRGKAFTIGDVGYLDEDGYLFLRDRAKDMIISGGVNIYPAEIEGVLTSHPKVSDVAVIGIPDPEWGESVKAIVQLAPGVDETAELVDELKAFCKAELASFKCPRSIDFRDELPRTEAGKLYKRLLRDEYGSDPTAPLST